MKRVSRVALFVGGLLAVTALPLLGRTLRADGAKRCALDGVDVPDRTKVRLVDASGGARLFCCVDCADRWLARSSAPPREVEVVDETTGTEIPAASAWFVRSRVVSFEVTGCHIHVFANETDARRHAEAFRGLVLVESERPLVGRQ